jgi:hypothetical protein
MRMTKVDMPELTALSVCALYNATRLTSFSAPALTTIGDYALYKAPCRKDIKCVSP